MNTTIEPLIKIKMRMLVKKGHEWLFEKLYDELVGNENAINTEILKMLDSSEARAETFIEKLEEYMCTSYGITNASIYQKTRKREIMSTRQVIMWTIKLTYPSMGLSSIGRRYGKDHTTVLHAMKQCDMRLSTERELRETLLRIFEKFITEGFEYEGKVMVDHINSINTLYKQL